jgi:hypothetical protein
VAETEQTVTDAIETEYATHCPIDDSIIPMGPRKHRTPYPEETDRARADRKVREADEWDCEFVKEQPHRHVLMQRTTPSWEPVAPTDEETTPASTPPHGGACQRTATPCEWVSENPPSWVRVGEVWCRVHDHVVTAESPAYEASAEEGARRLAWRIPHRSDADLRADARAVLSAVPPVIDAQHLTLQRAWSERTFGPGPRTKGVLDHIRKELKEIEDDPLDVKEWVDVVILALDGAWRAGWEPQAIIDAIKAKQVKNEARTWPDWRTMSEDQAIEHDRTLDPGGSA